MAEGVESPIDEAHGELSLARIALAEGDLQHAANHVAGAIGHAAQLPEVHELLAMLAARCDDGGLGLFPIGEPAYIGTVVAHAHLLARRDPGAALMLLAQATAYDPRMPWADVAWVRELAPQLVDPDQLTRVFVATMSSLGDPPSPEVRAANEVYLDLARRALAAHPEHALLHGAAAGIGRRLGDTGLAVCWGERAVRLEASKLTSVWYAYALKADRQLDEALQVMQRAREQNPLDLDLCADMANWLTDANRLDEALALIEEAMRIDPSYDCAVHTAHRLRFLRDGSPQHLVGLADYIREHPVESHQHTDLESSCQGRPWLGRLTAPTESVVNVLGQLTPEHRGADGNLSVSALEVPSALALLRRECPNLKVDIAGPPPPDMVRQLRPGRVLWRYDGLVAAPAVPPPSPLAADLLAGLAAPSWPHPIDAYDHALPLGQLPADELLALLVHPPARPTEFAELPDGWWERSAQVFACLGLLHCRELAEAARADPASGDPASADTAPGDTTAQRALLTEIAYGIEDWTTEAALFALTVAAWLDPACREEVRDTVGRRFVEAVTASRTRVVTILESLAELVRIVPDMVPEVTELADDVLTSLAREQAEASPAPASPASGSASGLGSAAQTSAPAKRSRLGRLFGR